MQTIALHFVTKGTIYHRIDSSTCSLAYQSRARNELFRLGASWRLMRNFGRQIMNLGHQLILNKTHIIQT